MSAKTRLLGLAWCGPLLLLAFTLGFVVFAGFLPPPSPTDSAREIAAMFRDDADAIRVGMVFGLAGMGLMIAWGVGLAATLRPAEGDPPVLTAIQLVCIGVGAMIGIVSMVLWAGAAFRADTLDPGTTRALNDMAWFMFLATWPAFSLWSGTVGLVILGDGGSPPVFPRWTGYLSIWCAVLYVPGSLILFFKDNAFAYNGLIGLWIPAVAFFGWLGVMMWFQFKATPE